MRNTVLVFAAVSLILCLTACTNQVQSTAETDPSILTTYPAIQAESPTTPVTEPFESQEPTEDISIQLPAGSYLMTYHNDELQDYLDYYLFVPENAMKHMPLIVFLHGDGEVGQPEKLEDYGLIRCAKEIYGESFPFICISPNTRVKSWTNDPIPELLKTLIDEVIKEYRIDENKIIIVGHSRGSAGVWHLASLYGNYFSAAVPISSPPQTGMNNENLLQVPIRAFAGTVSEFEQWAMVEMQKKVVNLRSLGADCEFIHLIGSSHDTSIENALTQDTFEWMLTQERNESENETIQ